METQKREIIEILKRKIKFIKKEKKQQQQALSKNIQNLPPEIREIIYNYFISNLLEKRNEKGWYWVHKELFPPIIAGILEEYFPSFPTYKYFWIKEHFNRTVFNLVTKIWLETIKGENFKPKHFFKEFIGFDDDYDFPLEQIVNIIERIILGD